MIRRLGAVLIAAVLCGCAPRDPGVALQAAPLQSSVDRTATSSLRYGAYEWNVDDAVSRWKAGTLWRLLAAKHVNDLLAGFTDAQIKKYSTQRGTDELNHMIADAGANGVRIELLLGDPAWILPSGAPTLEKILQQLGHISFSGLNLDLEPNEVRGYALRTVLEDLVRQMQQYVAASPWPVTLDVNVYYVNGAIDTDYCLICHLQDAGLTRIALLTYVGNPDTVATLAKPVLAKFPRMRFSIAQSVEPPSVLPRRDSYWSDGLKRFYRAMQQLDARATSARNYQGIVVQSMQYLETMKR